MNREELITWLKVQFFKKTQLHLPLSSDDMDNAQEAYWFFQENIKYNSTEYRKVRRFQDFIKLLLNIPPSSYYINHYIKKLIKNHQIFSRKIPRYGCILLNSRLNCILMVKSTSSIGTWNLPKGRIKYNEKPHECAIRETYEETGFYCMDINYDLFLEATLGKKYFGYFIILNVPMNYKFISKCPYEINDIQWILIKDVMEYCNEIRDRKVFYNNNEGYNNGNNNNYRLPKFRQVIPIIYQLQSFIEKIKNCR
uniref:Nudix hydrolase domain-containing protein n=1 Tax=Parastrongyloides trichosuri TaxID=131310 RepID=A0A0N4Z587_PARTI